MCDTDDGFCKLDNYIFIFYTYLFGRGNWGNNSLLVRTIYIVCTIPWQRLFVPNLIFFGVVLERSLEENSCSKSFYKTGEVINEGLSS